MRDLPDGADLRIAARRRGEGPLDDDADLVPTALAIAAREADAGDAPLQAECAALAGFYGEAAVADEPLPEALLRLNRRLAAELRAGGLALPGARRAAVARILIQVAEQKLDEVSPDYSRGRAGR